MYFPFVCVMPFSCLVSCRKLFKNPQSGGAVLLSNSSAVQISNCTFSSNMAVMNGGAIHIELQLITNVLTSSCYFIKNAAAACGGAMSIANGNAVEFVFKNCTFKKNVASGYGGALYFHEISTKILDSNFSQNRSPLTCAFFFNGSKDEMLIERSIFWKNIPLLVNTNSSAPTVLVYATKKFFARDVIFEENTSNGALTLFDTHRAVIHNSVFHKNTGEPFGALYAANTYLHIQNSSFVGNIGGFALTLYGTNCQLHIQSCRFAVTTRPSFFVGVFASKTIQVRSFNNVFVAGSQQDQNDVALVSRILANATAKVYLWHNIYEFSSNMTTLIDGNFLHNLSMPKIFNLRHVNMTVEFSQFASGEFNIVHTSRTNVLCEFLLPSLSKVATI